VKKQNKDEGKCTKNVTNNNNNNIICRGSSSEANIRSAIQEISHLIWKLNVHNIVTDLIKALPGNGSVNTFQHAII
jgi:hypothetical protein